MVLNCCVPDCTNYWQTGKTNLTYHRFPVCPELREKWLKATQRNKMDKYGQENIKDFIIYKSTRVCSAHFVEENYRMAGSLKKLRNNSVPTVFSWADTGNNVDEMSDKENIEPDILLQEGPSIRESETDTINTITPEEKVKVLGNKLEQMKEENLTLSARNAVLEKERQYLSLQNKRLRANVAMKAVFALENFKDNDKILYYTGFQTFDIFKSVFEYILPSGNSDDLMVGPDTPEKKLKRHSPTLAPEDQYFLTLIKLRRGLNHETLGDMFGISQSTVSRIFKCWINHLYLRLGALNIWPKKETILEKAPQDFLRNYPNVIGSIDCTEFYIETPSSMTIQSQCYSSYKHYTTMKSLIMIEPAGGIIYASPLFTGNISDKEIISKSGFISVLKKKIEKGHLMPGDIILADKGFNIQNILSELEIHINIPTFRLNGMQFSSNEIAHTREVAHERIHVERAIGRLKGYRILKNDIPVTLFGSINQIHLVCCLLSNFRYPLRNPKNSTSSESTA